VLVVAQSYSPHGAGFEPAALLVPETKVLFISAGERILAYQLEPPEKLWEDHADTGFLYWEQHGDTILLAAELEFAAWNHAGQKGRRAPAFEGPSPCYLGVDHGARSSGARGSEHSAASQWALLSTGDDHPHQ